MNKKTEAKCSGNTLTVGFHGATPPLIWRFDLERNHSFTLALQGEEGDWELGVTGPKGDFYPVVHFVAREDAEEAFARIEKILARRSSGAALIVKSLVWLVAVAILIVIGAGLFGMYANKPHMAAAISTPLTAAAPAPVVAPQDMPEGIPLPADQVLKPPAE